MPPYDQFDPEKYALYLHAIGSPQYKLSPAYQKARLRLMLVRFTIVFSTGTTLAFLALLYAIAFGKAHLPDSLVKIIAGATIGQFAGIPLLLYKALFAESADQRAASHGRKDHR